MSSYESEARLLRVIAQQLKTPLLQIARTSELALEQPDSQQYYEKINLISEAALRLVDGYLLSGENTQAQAIPIEPVSLPSVLNDAAHILTPYAGHFDCELELSIRGSLGPVMANKKTLESAMLLLGYSIIEGGVSNGRRRIALAAHKSRYGLVAGVYDEDASITKDMFMRGKALYGHAMQNLPKLTSGPSAGIFMADILLGTMESSLRVARHNKFSGLAATLHPSTQLSIV